MTKIEITPEVGSFLQKFAGHLNVKGELWYCMPYWITVKDGAYYITHFESLPDYVKECVVALRQGTAPLPTSEQRVAKPSE